VVKPLAIQTQSPSQVPIKIPVATRGDAQTTSMTDIEPTACKVLPDMGFSIFRNPLRAPTPTSIGP
jgi:hypothetical protein